MEQQEVVEAKRFLASIGAWPAIPADINPERWLSGFEPEHLEHAVAILDSFIFLSSRQVRKMFESGIHSLSHEVCSHLAEYSAKKEHWAEFLGTATFTMPTGEDPSEADSGYGYLRMARNILGIPENRLCHPDRLAAKLAGSADQTPLIFIDDFVGSGEQFMETWNTEVELEGKTLLLGELVAAKTSNVFYVPLVATEEAVDRVNREAPIVKLRPTHVLTEEYSLTHPDSIMLPAELRASVRSFVDDASDSAGIVSDYRFGFYELALAFAFEDSIPDASIALLWSREGSWYPLISRA